MAETIYLEPILRNFFSDRMAEMNFCLPARIDNVQNLKQGRVDVKPLYIPRYLDNTYSELPVVKNVLGELRPAVVAMIAAAGLTLVLLALFGTSSLSEITGSSLRWIELVLYIISLILLRKFKWGPISILAFTAVTGTLVYLLI